MDRAAIAACPIMVVGVVMLCGGCPPAHPKKRPPLHARPRLGKVIVSVHDRYGSMSLIKYRMRGVWVSIGFFDPSILPIGRVFLTSVGLLMGLPLTWRLLPARREAAARVGWRAPCGSARWRGGGTRRVPRRGRVAAYVRSDDGS